MGDVMSGQVVLSYMRKVTEHTKGSKLINTVLPRSLLGFLTSGSCLDFS